MQHEHEDLTHGDYVRPMLRHLRPFSPPADGESESLKSERREQALRLVHNFEEQGLGWFWETGLNGELIYITEAMDKSLSVAGVQAIGAILSDLFIPDPDSVYNARTLKYHFATKTAFRNYPVRSGSEVEDQWWSLSGKPRLDHEGKFSGFVGSATDTGEKMRAQAAITKLAYSDSLTGLANRERMRATIEHLLLTRQSGFNPTALLLIDLDRFKHVNDTMGHQVGDELLKQVACRLLRVVGDAGAIGRLGGDEFQISLASDRIRENVDLVCSNIIQSVAQPYFIANQPVSIGCSIGVAVAPEHGQTVDGLVANADLALYAAKAAGKGVHRVFTEDLLVDARRRRELEEDLHVALVKGELHLAYQAVVSTHSSKVVGLEALLRWTHPKRGVISPAEFIPVAEECGLIGKIGEWVLRTATLDAAQWPVEARVAVNVSPLQFANTELPSIVISAIANAGLNADRLELEITESVFLNEDDQSDAMFRTLKSIGVRLALDDFGTGYSSLGYLKNAPFDKIKIDQSFVRGAITTGNRNAAIIRAIVTLAQTLGMETTAEGVEQQDEIDFVRDLGCSHIQGFVYGKPMSQSEVMLTFGQQGAVAIPLGHKVSREKRERVMRSARLRIGHVEETVMVKNYSSNGAMVEAPSIDANLIGVDVLIELIEGQAWHGNVRWAEDGRMGLHLPRSLDTRLLKDLKNKTPVD